MSHQSRFLRCVGFACVLILLSAGLAGASSATLLLEEPYGKLGWFTATGHAAVYLSGVCAENPLVLRPCAPGEPGAVIARYNGVGGFDWLAVPLVPYLYAVEQTDDIPLFADPKLVNFLRDQYRRKHLEAVAPDLAGGQVPGGNWYELVGTAYDRTSYAFEIETSPQRDLEFIRAYNALQNRSHFRTVSSNCADFAKDVINFYYPHALHRSVIADVGISTPKQMARRMVKFSSRHSELEVSRYVIPQVPGSEARSTAVHGVVESFLKSKKYIVPAVVASPIFAGCVAAVDVGTEEGPEHFNPALHALVFNPDRDLEIPIGEEDRRSYEIELKHIETAETAGTAPVGKNFLRTMETAVPGFDSNGLPVLRVLAEDEEVNIGLAEGNILTTSSPNQFAHKILEARLREELRHGNPPKVSESDVERDWALLQKTLNRGQEQVASRSSQALQGDSESPGRIQP
ncbi:MAG: hypothetical protein WBZ11_01820 [Candidatus Sulfotelmatobacter sp.]